MVTASEFVAQVCDVAFGEGLETVGSKHPPPAYVRAVAGRVTAEVPKVETAFEGDLAFHIGAAC